MPQRLARGVRVGDRYRLEHELGRGEDGVTWEAVDERLDRHVALRIFEVGLDRKTMVKRAGVAASLTHPRVVRVFDTGEDSGRFFTVSELVSESLRTVRLPLPPDAALQAATDVAEALHYAHERGVVHGNLHEGNVLLSEGGAKVGDFCLAAAGEGAAKDDDLRSLGELMHRITRLPDPAAPPGFASAINGLANGAYRSAGEVWSELRALRPLPVAPREGSRRRGWVVVLTAALLAIAALGVMRLGERSPKEELLRGGRIEGTPLKIIGADDFDPPPGDGSEGPGTVAKVFDNDAQTFWSTERYRGGANFSGLKEGVGVILDLGEPTEVGKAQILFRAQGCSFDLRYSANPAAPIEEWSTVRSIEKSPTSAALEFESASARYWLVWITELAGMSGSFGCDVKEAELFAP